MPISGKKVSLKMKNNNDEFVTVLQGKYLREYAQRLATGKFTIEKDHWRVLKEIMGMDKDDKSRIELVNKPDNFILTAETAKEYNMVITTQPNPIVLRNVKKVLGDVPLVKPYKNKNKELTHFMKVEEVKVEYKYELFDVKPPKKQKPNKKKK